MSSWGISARPGYSGKGLCWFGRERSFLGFTAIVRYGGDIPDNLQGGNATSIPVQPGGDGLNIDWGETPLPVKVFWRLHLSYSIFF